MKEELSPQDHTNSTGLESGASTTPKPATVTIQLPRSRPIVTYSLLSITILTFILQNLSDSALGIDWPFLLGAKINELIQQGEVWRLLTPILLHGSIPHILFNMYALYSIGPEIERTYGHWKFLLLYLTAGFTGITASFLLSPNPSIGASTSIFGLVAAEGIFIYRNRFLFGKRARSMLSNIGFIVLINFLLGLSPGIDNWGHLGGLVGGLLFAWFIGPIFSLSGTYPEFKLVDKHNKSRDIWTFFLIVIFTASLDIIKIIAR